MGRQFGYRLEHRARGGYDATIIHADASATSLPQDRDVARLAVAVVSVTIMTTDVFSDWLAAQGISVIWVAGEERNHDWRFYPSEYSYTLLLAFSGAKFRRLLFRGAGTAQRAAAPEGPRPPPALVAESAAMRNLLAEAGMFADFRSNAFIHGMTPRLGRRGCVCCGQLRSGSSRAP